MTPFIFSRFLFLLIFVNLVLAVLRFSLSQSLCSDGEKSSLLQFKEAFVIDKSASGDPLAYPKVTLWNQVGGRSSDCCFWEGVECDVDTGHVIGLDLSSSFLYGSLDSNSSLFNLVHLRRLSLADNHFNYSQIPTAIKRLSMLTSLSLNASVFSGQIPSEVSELSNLSSLDLSENIDPLTRKRLLVLKKPDFKSLIANLTSLEQLHLSYVDISSTVPDSLANFSSLTSLLLKDCGLRGEFPVGIFELHNLQILSVGFNENLTGNLPEFKQSSSLKALKLAGTSFSGDLPTSIEKLASLYYLDATSCNFSGMIPTSIGKLNQLTYLDLSENNFMGHIPSSLANLTQLVQLWLYSNQLSGPIPFSLSKLQNLELLTVENNNLSGNVNFDMFLGLKNLRTLSLSDNNLSVIIKPGINDTLPQFKLLLLSNCNLRKFPEFLRHQERIDSLDLLGNNIGGRIPEWMFNKSRETFFLLYLSENDLIGEVPPAICNLRSLALLKMSYNKLSGSLPQCFGNFKSLLVLTLRNNSISGNIPIFTEGNQLRLADLGYNQLQGQVPHSLTNCRMLGYLNLENNRLDDVFPYWLGSLPELEVLVLRSNEFHGVIGEPKPHYEFPKLRIIDISFNNFTGKLPSSYIQSWKAMKSNMFWNSSYMMSIPKAESKGSNTISSFVNFRVTIKIKGVDRFYEKIQDIIAVISMSDNKFDGEIPQEIGNVKGIYSLDLSNNNLTGGIPSSLGNLTGLESLDLSRNELSGEIPQELTKLTFLQYLNVSHNHLTGPIPQANQLSRFESSSYEGNSGLCGIPLPNKCGNSEALDPPLPSHEEEEEESSSFFQFGWKVVVIGYGCGFVVGLFAGEFAIARKPNWFSMTFGIRNWQVIRKRRIGRRN
ncbi:LRR domain containing protein [Parasponia andersonii]|uniref:LRR domain containing protein n=1 Tax=Parasponia andersonii TaxID=3476 RepID=A0A2P5E5E6_PARAD|nr:LRR domain containing protein [Parasponia andersonii]